MDSQTVINNLLGELDYAWLLDEWNKYDRRLMLLAVSLSNEEFLGQMDDEFSDISMAIDGLAYFAIQIEHTYTSMKYPVRPNLVPSYIELKETIKKKAIT